MYIFTMYIYIYIYIYKKQWVTLPWSMTSMRSLSSTVLILWAIVSIVQCWKPSLMVCWIMLSVSESIDAVASSSRMIYEHYSIRHFKSKEYFRGYSGCLCSYFWIAKECSSHTHELPLSDREILSIFHYWRVQLLWQLSNLWERENERCGWFNTWMPECFFHILWLLYSIAVSLFFFMLPWPKVWKVLRGI